MANLMDKFKGMDTKQKIMVVGGSVIVLFFLIKAVTSRGSSGTSTTVTGAAGTDMNDIAQALSESVNGKLESQAEQTKTSMDKLLELLDLSNTANKDALQQLSDSTNNNLKLSNDAIISALNGISTKPGTDGTADYFNQLFGDMSAANAAANSSLQAQLAQMLQASQKANIAINPNPTSTKSTGSIGDSNGYNPSNYNQQTNDYVSGLVSNSGGNSVKNAADTVQQNQTILADTQAKAQAGLAQQQANANKGNSGSTAVVAKTEYLVNGVWVTK